MSAATTNTVVFGTSDIVNLGRQIRSSLAIAEIVMSAQPDTTPPANTTILVNAIRHDAKELIRLAKSIEKIFG